MDPGRGEPPHPKGTAGPAPMLFGREPDLGETTDLAAAEPERVEEMMAALERWREEVER